MHCAIYCSNPGSPEKESKSVLLLAYCSPTSMLSKGVHGCLGSVDSFSFSLVALKLSSLRKHWYTYVSHVSAD